MANQKLTKRGLSWGSSSWSFLDPAHPVPWIDLHHPDYEERAVSAILTVAVDHSRLPLLTSDHLRGLVLELIGVVLGPHHIAAMWHVLTQLSKMKEAVNTPKDLAKHVKRIKVKGSGASSRYRRNVLKVNGFSTDELSGPTSLVPSQGLADIETHSRIAWARIFDTSDSGVNRPHVYGRWETLSFLHPAEVEKVNQETGSVRARALEHLLSLVDSETVEEWVAEDTAAVDVNSCS